jgi:hypothetical protein
VRFFINNQSKDIVLKNGICSLLKEANAAQPIIFPGTQDDMSVELSGMLKRQTQCYLMYELVMLGHKEMPLVENYRAFFAVEAYYKTISKRCTVSAAIFMTKYSQFSSSIEELDRLRKNVLQRYIVRYDKDTFRFNIGGRSLELIVELINTKNTCICVELRCNGYDNRGGSSGDTTR